MERLRILHTNDLHSHFEHFPKIKRFLESAQNDSSFDQILTFDAGDFMDRSHPLSDATLGQFNVSLMNSFHYDALTIGNNEGISNSHTVLEHLFDQAKFSVILGNLREENEAMPTWCVPYQIYTTPKGTRIAVLGLTAAYPMTYAPNHWHIKLVSTVMPELLQKIAGQYDFLILLTHIGVMMDRWVAHHYPQIDLIVGGHSHTYLPHGEKVGSTWIVQTGKWGEHIGEVCVELDVHHQVMQIKPQTVNIAELPEKAGDQALIASYQARGKQILDETKIAQLPVLFNGDKNAAIKVSLDAVADFAHTELAMLNSGLFLSPFKSGVISQYDLQQALPHPMHVVRAQLRGSDLWRLIMEMEKNRHYLMHFPLKGMSFRGKVFGDICYKGIYVSHARRLVYINGKELDPNENYQIAVLDHHVLVPFFPTLAIMGDNTFLFPKFLREVVADYLAKKYPIKNGGGDFEKQSIGEKSRKKFKNE